VAAEWDAQGDEIAPLSMVLTRSANAAIDKVVHQHAEVADMLAAYGGTDLLCYRATEPQELVQRQNELWNPVLDWAEGALGARLVTAAGVMFIAQAEDHLEALRAPIHAMSAFEVAAFHDLVSLSGSLILGYAAVHDMCPVEDIWQLSRLDETWQIEQWGVDDEAAELAETKRLAFIHAHKFYQMAKT
jgi:chaperone required for assembly of F1-ATPase